MSSEPSNPTKPDFALPNRPIRRLTNPLERFLHVEAASGITLLIATAAALALANSELADELTAFLKTAVSIGFGDFQMSHSLKHWINDGLMAVFFFVIGLEVKRELVLGELQDFRRAALPLMAAIGGMVVPAALYLTLEHDGAAARGWGIPMATDIAFVVGCLAVLGSRVPKGLRVMLLSLAIADDIGAILVIAIGYTDAIHFVPLGIGFGALLVVEVAARLGVRSLGIYTLLGIVVWVAFHESGIHATIAGVLLGLMTPARPFLDHTVFAEALQRAGHFLHGAWDRRPHGAGKLTEFRHAARETISPLEFLENRLHPWVGFAIMPIFAFANAGVAVSIDDAASPVALAILVGLVVGKPLGIFAMSWLAVKSGIAKLPTGVTWPAVIGGGFLAGIGFTMALFIAGLALEGPILEQAKVGILGSSVIAAVIGFVILLVALPKKSAVDQPET